MEQAIEIINYLNICSDFNYNFGIFKNILRIWIWGGEKKNVVSIIIATDDMKAGLFFVLNNNRSQSWRWGTKCNCKV